MNVGPGSPFNYGFIRNFASRIIINVGYRIFNAIAEVVTPVCTIKEYISLVYLTEFGEVIEGGAIIFQRYEYLYSVVHTVYKFSITLSIRICDFIRSHYVRISDVIVTNIHCK